MKLVDDESLDFVIINLLQQKRFNVVSIAENYPSINDTEVLKISNENNCLLITEDKDFGELTYRLKLKNCGILLIRLSDMPRQERLVFAVVFIEEYFEKLQNNFSVLTKNGLRIKTT